MYKDKDKQREANAERQRRYKAKHKGVTIEGVTGEALPSLDNTSTTVRTGGGVIPESMTDERSNEPSNVKPKRGKDKPYQMTVMERLFYRPANKLKPGESNFVSLPGRACYG